MSDDVLSMTVDSDGTRPLVVKQARGGAAADRLRHEVIALRAAQHPGVVTLVDSCDDGEEVVLRTRFCSSRTLASVAPLPVEKAAGILAALATTVADLHDLGIRHGRISADHVLIAADGRPVLCGFAGATLSRSGAPTSADDVAAMGRLLRESLAPVEEMEPIPNTRWGRRGAWTGYQRRALLNLADQATAHDPSLRPTARQLATNLRSSVPQAAIATEPEGEPAGAERPGLRTILGSHRQAKLLLGIGVVAAALLALVLGTALRSGSGGASADLADGAHRPAAPPPPPPHTAPPPDPSTTTTTAPPPRPVAAAASAPSLVDPAVAGCSITPVPQAAAAAAHDNPCPVHLELRDGVLSVGELRFGLQLDDAAVAIGDFTCDGALLPAVLDLGDGHVYVFERWPSEGGEEAAAALARVSDAARIEAEPVSTTGCHRLVVLDRWGVRHPLGTPEVTG